MSAVTWTVHPKNPYGLTRFEPNQPVIEAKVDFLTEQQFKELTGNTFAVGHYYSHGHATEARATFFFGSLAEAETLAPALKSIELEGVAATRHELETKVAPKFREACPGGKAVG